VIRQDSTPRSYQIRSNGRNIRRNRAHIRPIAVGPTMNTPPAARVIVREPVITPKVAMPTKILPKVLFRSDDPCKNVVQSDIPKNIKVSFKDTPEIRVIPSNDRTPHQNDPGPSTTPSKGPSTRPSTGPPTGRPSTYATKSGRVVKPNSRYS
jgi:hypothetical protein